jgi:hypothetical protein
VVGEADEVVAGIPVGAHHGRGLEQAVGRVGVTMELAAEEVGRSSVFSRSLSTAVFYCTILL